jgi:rare lipoprotein A
MTTRTVAQALALSSALMLCACGGVTPIKQGEVRRDPGSAAPAPPSTVATPRGGGYYKDDGPLDRIPADLDRVPDAQPRAEPIRPANSRPYVALGQTFTPMQALEPFSQEGRASWYGKKFHGQRTASGERYDMFAMTAAHPTLPIPSYARVTNLENGKSVVVRINDRGPFHKGRVIDLSYTAAHKLGYIGQGSVNVRVDSIMPEGVELVARERAKPGSPSPAPQNTPSAAQALEQGPVPERILNGALDPEVSASVAEPARNKEIYLQLGSFADAANARAFRDYAQQELGIFESGIRIVSDGTRYRLHLGPFATQIEARERAERVAQRLRLKPFVVLN